MFLFATVTDPIGGMLLRLCGPGNPAVTPSAFSQTSLTEI
jgi:hypothetical protein